MKSMPQNHHAWLLSAIIFLGGMSACCFGQYQFTTIDDPNGIGSTTLAGIDGANIVGNYTDASGSNAAFLLSGGTYTTLPNINESSSMVSVGISGSNILCYSYGAQTLYYLLSGTTYTYLNLLDNFYAGGISGNEIVGYGSPGGSYILSGTTFTYIRYFGTNGGYYDTYAQGIYGNEVVGTYSPYWDAGFLLSGTTYTQLNDPEAKPINVGNDYEGTMTFPTAIDADGIVGDYYDANYFNHGFILTGTTYTDVDDPLGTEGTFPTGISGNTIVGYYKDSSGATHGFIASPVPEPGNLCFIAYAICGLLLFVKSGVETGLSGEKWTLWQWQGLAVNALKKAAFALGLRKIGG